jgi:prevent-host-death family protein
MSTATKTVSIYDAKTHLSQLITEIEAGVEITISRHGKPVAKLIPFTADRPPRTPGALKGQIVTPDGWDTLAEQDTQDWYGA